MNRHGDKKKQIVGEIYPQKILEQVPYPKVIRILVKSVDSQTLVKI